jgi:peptide/nickel transport system substrate-binding protein
MSIKGISNTQALAIGLVVIIVAAGGLYVVLSPGSPATIIQTQVQTQTQVLTQTQVQTTTQVQTQTQVQTATQVQTQTQTQTRTQTQTQTVTATTPRVFTNHTFLAITTGTVNELDPQFNIDVWVAWNTYDNLVRVSYLDGKVKTIPQLAVSWSSNPTATEWTFNLRPNVKFHDGTPFTAEAVKFSLGRLLALSYFNSPTVSRPIDKVEVVNDLTVKITTKFPIDLPTQLSGFWSAFISSPSMYRDALAAGWINSTDSDNAKAIKVRDKFKATGALGPHDESYGTGPYRVKPGSYDPTKGVVLVRNDGYWAGWESKQINTVIINVVTDRALATRLLAQGEADFIHQNPLIQFIPDLLTSPHTNVMSALDININYIQYNTQKPPLDNVLVRRALSYAIDYKAAVDVPLLGNGVAHGLGFTGYVPKNLPFYSDKVPSYTYDLAKAKELLRRAGYADGKLNAKLLLTYDIQWPDHAATVEAMRPGWRELGVEIDARAMQIGAWFALGFKGNLGKAPLEAQDVTLVKWAPAMFATFSNLESRFGSGSGAPGIFNWSYWVNEDFMKLLQEAWANEIPNPQRAQELYIQLQTLLHNEAVGIALNNPMSVAAISRNWSGYVVDPGHGKASIYYHDLRYVGA